MIKRKITEEEILFVSRIFTKTIRNSSLIIFILLYFFSAFLYCLFINLVEYLIVKIILIIIVSFLGFFIFNSIYSIICLNKEINTCNIDRIEAEFKVQNKDILTYTYDIVFVKKAFNKSLCKSIIIMPFIQTTLILLYK